MCIGSRRKKAAPREVNKTVQILAMTHCQSVCYWNFGIESPFSGRNQKLRFRSMCCVVGVGSSSFWSCCSSWPAKPWSCYDQHNSYLGYDIPATR